VRNVKKEGSNFGKQFFACSKPQSDSTKCDFFQWNDGNGDTACISRFEQNVQMNTSNKTKCNCNLIAVTKTSSKAGANQGRQFYTCTKSGSRCNFFQWVDEEGSSFTQGSSRGNSSKFTAGQSGSITCFKCGQEGHFATNCNSRNNKTRSSGKSFKGKKRKSQYEDY
jgi:DNA topoisomerase-3